MNAKLFLSTLCLLALNPACRKQASDLNEEDDGIAKTRHVTMQTEDGRSQVDLIGLLHVAPDAFYQEIYEKIKSASKRISGNEKIDVYQEGVQCSGNKLDMQKVVDTMELPNIDDLNARFTDAVITKVLMGGRDLAIENYFVNYFKKWIDKGGLKSKIARIPCRSTGSSSSGLNSNYEKISAALNENSQIKWSFQGNPNSSYSKIQQITNVNLISIDIDQSEMDESNPRHLIWMTWFSSVNGGLDIGINPEAWTIVLNIGSTINIGPLRNDTVVKSLTNNKKAGAAHSFVLWGNAHIPNFEQLLKSKGYTTTQAGGIFLTGCEKAKPLSIQESLCDVARD